MKKFLLFLLVCGLCVGAYFIGLNGGFVKSFHKVADTITEKLSSNKNEDTPTTTTKKTTTSSEKPTPSTEVPTTTTFKTTSKTSNSEPLTCELKKDTLEFTYGVTKGELDAAIRGNYVTNATEIGYAIDEGFIACGTHTTIITFKKGEQKVEKTVKIIVNPNDNGLDAYLSTDTKSWWWDVSPSLFRFDVYFVNNTGKDIKNFECLIGYSIDGYVKATTYGTDIKLDSGENIKNGEEFTIRFEVNYNSAFSTLSEEKWFNEVTVGEGVQTGFDYNYWYNLNRSVIYTIKPYRLIPENGITYVE